MILRAAAVGLALATAASGVVVALRQPWPAGSANRPAAASTTDRLALPAADPGVVCSGPETAIVPDGSSAQPPSGTVTLTAAAGGTGSAGAAIAPLASTAHAATTALAGSGVRVLLQTEGIVAPLRLASGGTSGAGNARLDAVQTTFARTGDRRGLAAGACATATADAWLVGGATSTGRRARLLLLDPTPAPAVVDVVVLGPHGPVDVPSARGLVVAPGRARAVQLDALAPGLDRIAVHVVARRGRVTPVLDDSRLDGATAAGVDDVPVAAAASRHLTLPGVVVPVPPAAGSATAVVRLAVPGGDDAVVHVHLAGPGGDTPVGRSGVVTVPAGSVVDVPVPGLRPGAYAVLADADVPIVAGTMVRVAGAPAGVLHRAEADIGWTSSSLPLTGGTVAALPRATGVGPHGLGPATGLRRLALTAGPRGVDVVVGQLGPRGEALGQTSVHIAARRTAVLAVSPGAAAITLGTGAGQQVWAGVAAVATDPAGPMLALVPVTPPAAADHDALDAVRDPWLPQVSLSRGQSSQSSSLP